MKLFIWNSANNVTGNWHDGGGVIAIADTLERARRLIGPKTGKDDQECTALTDPPDLVHECEGPEFFVVHPDAGCC